MELIIQSRSTSNGATLGPLLSTKTYLPNSWPRSRPPSKRLSKSRSEFADASTRGLVVFAASLRLQDSGQEKKFRVGGRKLAIVLPSFSCRERKRKAIKSAKQVFLHRSIFIHSADSGSGAAPRARSGMHDGMRVHGMCVHGMCVHGMCTTICASVRPEVRPGPAARRQRRTRPWTRARRAATPTP